MYTEVCTIRSFEMTAPISMKRNNYNSYQMYEQRPTFRKIAVATASGIIPGLGQAVNGEWGKAGIFLGSGVALSLLGANCLKKGAKLPGYLFAIGASAVRAYSTVDSYIHSK